MKFLVVAYDKNRGIGTGDDLPWGRDLPADLRRFRALTTGKSVVMGRKTFESIGRPLPNRQNIVLSRSLSELDGANIAHSLEQAYGLANTDEIAVIGGESVFREALSSASVVFATEVQANFPGTTVYFPELGPEWQEVSREHHARDHENLFDFDYVTYKKAASL